MFKSISAGRSHTCGILTNGSAYCWGDNEYGQLGTGLNSAQLANSSNPAAVNTTSRMWPFYTQGQSINVANISYDVIIGQNWTFECTVDEGLNLTSSLNSSKITIEYPSLAITLTSPANQSIVNSSYHILLNLSTNETATCRYFINSGSYLPLNSGNYRTNFSTYFNIYSNANHTISVNCTDLYSNSTFSRINLTINDTIAPVITINSEVADTSTINITFSTEEPANWTLVLGNETPRTYSYFANTSSVRFTDLESGTRYNYTIIACDQLNNCGEESDYKYTSSEEEEEEEDDEDSTPGGGTTSTTGSTSIKVTQEWSSPDAGQYIMNIPTSQIAITQIIFVLRNDINGIVLFSVEKISSLPSFVPSVGEKLYQYIKIDKSLIRDSNLTSVKIKFRVDKSWITTNKINQDTIFLYRYTDDWDKISTKKTSNDSNYVYYEADSPGLSYFSIKGDVSEETAPTPQDNQQPANNQNEQPATGNLVVEQNQNEQPTITQTKTSFSWVLIPLFLIIIIIGGVGGFLIYQRNTSVLSDTDLNDIKTYVQKCKAEGVEFSSIKTTLLKVGWPESVIDLVLHDVHLPAQDMSNLLTYINYMRINNKSEQEIKTNLKSAGWQEEIIQEAIEAVNDQNRKR